MRISDAFFQANAQMQRERSLASAARVGVACARREAPRKRAIARLGAGQEAVACWVTLSVVA